MCDTFLTRDLLPPAFTPVITEGDGSIGVSADTTFGDIVIGDANLVSSPWGISLANLTTIDGVRVDYAKGWGLVRASNTTPVLVLRFEADDEAELQRIKDVFHTQLKRVAPDLQLPF